MERRRLRISLLGLAGIIALISSLLAGFVSISSPNPSSDTTLSVNPIPRWTSEAERSRPSEVERELALKWQGSLKRIKVQFEAHMAASSVDVTRTGIHYVVADDCYRISYDWQHRSGDDTGSDMLTLRRNGDQYSQPADRRHMQQHPSVAATVAQSFKVTLPGPPQPASTE